MRAPEPTATRVIGRYALYNEIASGGMATVHFGRLLGPVGFSRTVAIKRLHPQFAKDPEFVSMFLDEARLAARIRHPNVVPTLDVVATQGELFLVMDYVQGESLARLIRAMRAMRTAIPPSIVVTILSGVLHGLHSAHEAKNEQGEPMGIVHRDVSPQNILVGIDGVPRILDFGVAKAAGRLQTTRDGQIKGKLAYMPPEQLRGSALSRHTDIYAASVVLWEALTSQRLFSGDNEGAVLTKIMEAPVPPPSALVKGLPPSIDEVTLKGLARDPQKRFTTARDMALALQRCFPLAPPSEVGEWVERTAGAELLMRAERIAEIESSSSMNLAGSAAPGSTKELNDYISSVSRNAPLAVPTPGIPIDVDATISSQLSSISVARSGSSVGHDDKRKRLALAVIALLAVAVLVLGVGALARRGPNTADVAAAGSPPASTPPPIATPSMASALPPPASIFAPPPPSVASSVAAPSVRPPHHVHGNATAGQTHPQESCDPPYTLDAEGHKHYKLNCL